MCIYIYCFTWFHLFGDCSMYQYQLLVHEFISHVIDPKVLRKYVRSCFCSYSFAPLLYIAVYGGFHKWGYPHSWMVYKGKSQEKGWFRGIPISWTLQGRVKALAPNRATPRIQPVFQGLDRLRWCLEIQGMFSHQFQMGGSTMGVPLNLTSD